MTRDADISATLRSLDPADHHVGPGGARARADLDAILATDPTAPVPRAPERVAARRRAPRPARAPRRLVAVTGMVAAVTAGLVLVPSFAGGDRAFATWTAAPTGLSTQEQAQAVVDCRDSHLDGPGGAAELAEDLSTAHPVVAERRGAWVTVVLGGPDGFSAMCITDDSTHLVADAMIGSIGTPAGYVAPGPRQLVATSLGVGSTGSGDLSLIAGTAGPDVVGVVFRSRTQGEVIATVSQGHFALWFPGDELATGATEGVEVEATHTDGTTTTQRLTL